MGFLDRWFGPREDEPEQETIPEPESPPVILEGDWKIVNDWVDKGFRVNFFLWPVDEYHGKRVSVTAESKSKGVRVDCQFHDTARACLEEISENFSDLGLTIDEDPDSINSVAPRGSELESEALDN